MAKPSLQQANHICQSRLLPVFATNVSRQDKPLGWSNMVDNVEFGVAESFFSAIFLDRNHKERNQAHVFDSFCLQSVHIVCLYTPHTNKCKQSCFNSSRFPKERRQKCCCVLFEVENVRACVSSSIPSECRRSSAVLISPIQMNPSESIWISPTNQSMCLLSRPLVA